MDTLEKITKIPPLLNQFTVGIQNNHPW